MTSLLLFTSSDDRKNESPIDRCTHDFMMKYFQVHGMGKVLWKIPEYFCHLYAVDHTVLSVLQTEVYSEIRLKMSQEF